MILTNHIVQRTAIPATGIVNVPRGARGAAEPGEAVTRPGLQQGLAVRSKWA